MIQKQIDLYYKDRKSDKEYHLQLRSQGPGYTLGRGYTVTAQFGPRGGTLTHVDLSKGVSSTYREALDLFNKKEAEKRAKGYTESIGSKLADRLESELPFVLTRYNTIKLAEWIERYVEEQT